MNMHPLTVNDDARAATLLARAFRNDPIMNWLCPNIDFLPQLFGVGVPVFREQGISYKAAADQGVALWMPPGRKAHWPGGLLGLLKFVEVGGWRGLYRLALSGAKLERAHPKTPHYYLFAIGIAPEAEGQGVGSELIAHVLQRCDQERVPAYLENSNPRNLTFYRKHGFQVMREFRPTRHSPTMWLMWREPDNPLNLDPAVERGI